MPLAIEPISIAAVKQLKFPLRFIFLTEDGKNMTRLTDERAPLANGRAPLAIGVLGNNSRCLIKWLVGVEHLVPKPCVFCGVET
jgi:hypothetical protein